MSGRIIDPALPIVDARNHLRDRAGQCHLLDAWPAATGGGHRIDATVFVLCTAFNRAHGPMALQPAGETEFANGVGAMAASGQYGATRACAAIVGHAGLRPGPPVREVLEVQISAGNGRFRGIRHPAGRDADDRIRPSHRRPSPQLYLDRRFREGFAELAPLGLTLRAWEYRPQLPDPIALARALERTPIALDHAGGRSGSGSTRARPTRPLHAGSAASRNSPAVRCAGIELGGLGMKIGPFDRHGRAVGPTSEELARAWRPWIETCIDAFGAQRCMFESNFPVKKASTGCAVLRDAFKRLGTGASASENVALFSGTARSVHRLDLPDQEQAR